MSEPYGQTPPADDQPLDGLALVFVVLGGLGAPVLPLILWLIWRTSAPVKARQSMQVFLIMAALWVLGICCAAFMMLAPLAIFQSVPSTYVY